jgi:hypothetical protein
MANAKRLAQVHLGQALLKLGRTAEAQEAFVAGGYPEGLVTISDQLVDARQFEAALKTLKAAGSRGQKKLFPLGIILLERRLLGPALEAFDAGQVEPPKDKVVALGNWLMDQGQLDEALAAFTAVRHRPGLLELVRLYVSKYLAEKAVKAARATGDEGVLRELADLFHEKGWLSDALELYLEFKDDAGILKVRTSALEVYDLETALAALKLIGDRAGLKAVGDLFYNRGESGDLELAREAFEVAQDVAALLKMGARFLEDNRREEALATFELAAGLEEEGLEEEG